MFEIVFLAPHSDPQAKLGEPDSGGQCIYELELAKSLSHLPDTRVTVYTRKKFDHPAISHVNKNFTIKRITCGGDGFVPKEALGPLLDEFTQKVAADLNGTVPSVAHGHYWDGGKVALLLHKYISPVRRAFPIIWTPHSLGAIKRRHFMGLKEEAHFHFTTRVAWETIVMQQSDLVIVSTENEKDHAVYDYAIEPKKIKIVPPGIDTANFRPTKKHDGREFFGLPEDALVLMSLGRMDKRKGYHNCINVLAECRRRFRMPAELLIVGGGQPMSADEEKYMKELRQIARHQRVSQYVHFHPSIRHDEVRYVYAAADVYLCLSDYEPFGLTVLESMYMGVPVIATNNGGPVNIITNNYHGIVVSPKNNSQIATYILSLINDISLRKEITKNARRLAEAKYAWQERVKEFYSCYLHASRSQFKKERQSLFDSIKYI